MTMRNDNTNKYARNPSFTTYNVELILLIEAWLVRRLHPIIGVEH